MKRIKGVCVKAKRKKDCVLLLLLNQGFDTESGRMVREVVNKCISRQQPMSVKTGIIAWAFGEDNDRAPLPCLAVP